jgi:tRNA A-37 threonylcarbamoyl transferase component Bud32
MKCPKCETVNPDTSHFCADCGTKLILPEESPVTQTVMPRRYVNLAAEGNIFAGKYKIIEELGKGGMGVVYKAEDIKLRRTVALKFLPPDLTRNTLAKERFVQEAQAASALDHNNICTIHEIDETEEGQLFIVMAFYEGKTLKKKIESGLLEIDQVVDIALQVARGLAKAHEHGIIHRDIKPANIMLTQDGVAKVVDFGLAKLAGQTQLTKTATTMGTIAYISPEQSRGEKVDQRTDIWALGVMLYEMITGQLPFKGEYEPAVVHAIVNDEPKPIRNIRPDVPAELEKIVGLTMKKDAAKRFQQVHEIVEALSSLQKKIESGLLVRTKEELAQRHRRKKYLLAALAVLAILVVLAAVFFRQRGRALRTEEMIARLQPAAQAHLYDKVLDIMASSGLSLQDIKNKNLLQQISGNLSIESQPLKAQVSLARIRSKPELSLGKPANIGRTPLSGYPLVAGEYQISLSLEEMNPLKFLVDVKPGEALEISRTLVKVSNGLAGMVMVNQGISQNGAEIPAFLMDRHEVTNGAFFDFVSAGGYREKKYWADSMTISGLAVSWEQAMKTFVDKTGIPGPRLWAGGRYPDEKKDHPVVGISWYEAAAYARWAGKNLLSWDEWWLAALGGTASVFPWGNDVQSSFRRANFDLKGTQPVESFPLGISPFGCYDMAGNVREWLLDSKSDTGLRTVVGGSWADTSYMFEASHAEFFKPDFASDYIGFRCMKPNAAAQSK